MLVKETQLKVLLQIYRKIDIVWGNRAVTSPKDSWCVRKSIGTEEDIV